MVKLNRYAIAGASLAVALSIGVVMQAGPSTAPVRTVAEPPTAPAAGPGLSKVTDVTLTAASTVRPPQEAAAPALLPAAPDRVVAVSAPVAQEMPQEAPAPDFDCDVALSASVGEAAIVDLVLDAACLAGQEVTLHHNGMMISTPTDLSGRTRLSVPALAEKAVFIASFGSGEGAVSVIDVPAITEYDRIAVQWQGETGLHLHAREFDADYGSDGHVWAGAARDSAAAASGRGFVTRLGSPMVPAPLMAEIYTFPRGMARRAGDVALSVETEITAANCGRDIRAQTIEYRHDDSAKVQDVTLFVPECDGIGDFLVLKNLVEDLKIAAR